MRFERRGLRFEVICALVDAVPGEAEITVRDGELASIDVRVEGGPALLSLGVRIAVTGACAYLRNGYQSWDGSYFVAPGTPAGDGPAAKAPTLGFAMTALLPLGGGAVVLGVDRHDRFQTRFSFAGDAERLLIDVECLLDRTGATAMETLHLFDSDDVEGTLRRWSGRVATASPLAPRVPATRLTGWCSWYNHYAAIDAPTIEREIASAAAFRDKHRAPLDIFLIDDGFTPEMGDWLEVKPQFPDGVAPLLAKAEAAGFVPGLWWAPFLVGNRSRLAREHPDWLVKDRTSGEPLVAFHFHGEFRWHKRSEEYHVMDITHTEVCEYVAEVARTWTQKWRARYLKLDFLLHGAEYGPDRARWHEDGLSRIEIYRRMMTTIRDAVGPDVILAGSGCALWASVGLVDAVRIARDVGVTWHGEYSAESLLRDQQVRNHGHGLLWQADPDCVLLRDRFHSLTDGEVEALARFASGTGGVLMTSDTLSELSPERQALFAELLRQPATGCDYPLLGNGGAVVEQRVRAGERMIATNLFNPTDQTAALDGMVVPPHALLSR